MLFRSQVALRIAKTALPNARERVASQRVKTALPNARERVASQRVKTALPNTRERAESVQVHSQSVTCVIKRTGCWFLAQNANAEHVPALSNTINIALHTHGTCRVHCKLNKEK